MKKNNKIKIGIPEGSLRSVIERFFIGAGYDFKIMEKPLFVFIDDPEIECFLDRANGIASLISQGVLDGGIISKSAVLEGEADSLEEVCIIGAPTSDLKETKIVLAVPNNSPIKSIKDLNGKKIITRVPKITKEFLKKEKISATIEISQNSNEAKVPDLADALVEFVNTGSTLKFYNLKILKVLFENVNTISIYANSDSLKDKWKKEKMDKVGLLLRGARLAEDYVGLMLHASNDMMEEVFEILPSLKKPTVTHLRGENWFDVFSVVEKKKARIIIPKLKRIGCTDIVEFPLKKVII